MKCLKAIIAVSLAAALAAVFCGCGVSDSSENESSEVSSESVSVSGDTGSESESETEGETESKEESETESESSLTSTADDKTAVSEVVNEESEKEKTESDREEEKADEESVCHEKLVEVISNSGANGYTVGHIGNSDGYFLMLSFGEVEASRYYDVYRIDTDDVVLVQSMLVGSHTVAYIDEDTGCLAIYQAHMGHYGYGDLTYTDGGVSIDWLEDNGVIGNDEDYPPVSGEVVEFTSIDDFSLIVNF